MYSQSRYLMHYGILGMHWGIIRDRDSSVGSKNAMPLNPKNVAKARKYYDRADQAQKAINEMDKLGIKSPRMRELYGKGVDQSDRIFAFAFATSKQHAVDSERKNLVKIVERNKKDAYAKEHGKLTRGQKIAIGVGIGVGVAAFLAIYANHKMSDLPIGPGQRISVEKFSERYLKRIQDVAKGVTPEEFAKMSDVEHRVPAGTIFHRITAFPDENLGKKLYATYTEADNDKYQGLYGDMLRMRTNKSDIFISHMTMKEDVVSPSPKKRVQILMDLMDEKLVSNGHQVSGRELFNERFNDFMEFWGGIRNPENLSNKDAVLKAYKSFAASTVNDTDPLVKAYFDKVKSAGYNAIIDDNDAGKLSDSPMILLNAVKTVGSRSSIPLTDRLAQEARDRLVDILEG